MPTPKSHLDLHRNYILRALQPLQVWAIRPQAERDLEHVFGTNINWALAFKLLSAFRDGDYSSLPPVSILSPSSMPGLWGGYSRDARAIYISADCPNEMLSAVLIEEIGHFLDQEICTEETPGEEGALFAALVMGLPLETASNDDSLAPVFVHGRQILVEAARKIRGSSKGKSSGKSSGKKRGGGNLNNGAGYAVAGSGSSNPQVQASSIHYAIKDDARIPQTAPGDRLIGSRGNDTFVVNSQNVQIEDPNGGTDTVESPITFSLANYSPIENLVLTGSANISGTGNNAANLITGNSGNNSLDGGVDTANDTLIGGNGNDTYVVRDTLDQIVEAAGGGTDTIQTTLSTFSMATYANVENLAYSGTATGVSFTGNSVNNTINGTAGADSLDGGAGVDSLIGGAGNDTYLVDDSGDRIFENANAGTDLALSTASTYALEDNVENLLLAGSSNISGTGNALGNSLTGNSANNSLNGGDGNDTILGGGGSDTFIGGDGNDLYIFKGDVNISSTGSGGTDTVWAYSSNTLASGVEVLQLFDTDPSLVPIYDATTDIADTALSNTTEIFTNGVAINSEIEAKSGLGDNDWVKVNLVAGNTYQFDMKGSSTSRGTLGQCRMELYANTSFTTPVATDAGGSGTDDFFLYIPTYSGYHYIRAFSFSDTGTYELTVNLTAVGPNNYLTGVGSSDNNTLIGSAARNTLSGMVGDDSLFGGDGVDTLIGGTGNDSYFNDGSDLIIEVAGGGTADYVESAVTYTLAANLEVLQLTGAETISGFGNLGNNTITGNAADNTLDGGAGNDSLVGGIGNDTYFVDSAGDVIVEAASEGTDLVVSTVSHSLGNNLENLTYAGLVNASLTGNTADNVIDGSAAGINTLRGGDGNDTLVVNSARLGDIDGGTGTNRLRILGDSLSLNDVGLTNIQVLDLSSISTLAGSVSVTLGGNSTSLDTLIGSAKSDSITAVAGFGKSITIDGGAGGDRFAFSSVTQMAAASLFGGEGADTLAYSSAITNLVDANFTNLSGSSIEVLELSDIGNRATLGANAEAAGIATIVGGTDDDKIDASGYVVKGVTIDVSRNRVVEGAANTENTVIGGGGGDLILMSNHNVLAASSIVGNGGIDTLAFAENGISITDDKFVGNISSVEMLQTKDGTNYIQIGTNAATSGLRSLVGGAGSDTFDASVFAGSIAIDAGLGADSVIVKDVASIGAGTLVGGGGADTLSIGTAGNLVDEDLADVRGFEVLKAAESGSSTLTVGQYAEAGGIQVVIGGGFDDTLDAMGYAGAVTLLGGEGNDNLVVSTGDRLRLQSIDGGAGTDTLTFAVDALAVTDADFAKVNSVSVVRALQGNNRIVLGNNAQSAGVASLIGGTGNDTLSVAGYDTLSFTSEYDYSIDGATLSGGGGANSMVGGARADAFLNTTTSDTVDGGQGTNALLFTGSSVADGLIGTGSKNLQQIKLLGASGVSATIGLGYQDAGVKEVLGGAGNDAINAGATTAGMSLDGGAGNDEVTGGTGNDTLKSNSGSDTFIGGDGNDLYIIKADVTVSATGSEGTDTVWAYANQTLSSGVEVLQLFDVDPSLVPIYDSTTDIADSALSSTTEIFTNGVAINSEIEAKSGLGDDDWVKVNLVAGNTYQFNMKGSSTNRGTLGQCRMELYANTSFTTAVATDAGGEGSDDLFNYTPTYSGYHYIKTFSNNSGTGTYELTVNLTAVGPNNLLSGVGSTDNNTLIGSAARNSLSGMGGDDSLFGGDGVDTLTGGTGNDSYFNDGSDLIIENAGEGNADYVESATTYTLAANLEVLQLTGSDTISGIGNAGNNTISGNASANSLNGGAGNDSLIGGAGNDTYFVDSSSDVIVEAANEGTDLVISTVSHSLGNNLENLTYAGLTRASLLGNSLDNIINGSAEGINTLEGGDGNDTLIVHGRRIGNINGGDDTDLLRLTGDLLAFRNPSFTNIEVLDLSLLSGSASVTLDSAAAGLGTLVASSFNDTIDASAYTASILIDASAGSGSRLIGATGVGLVNTLIGGANGGNEFVLDAIGTNSLVGGFGGLDTLTLTNGGVLLDSAFTPISKIGTLKLEGTTNTVTLGANALIAGIRTLVGGEGNDLGTGNSINTSAYGSAGVLFQVTDQDYLANITTLVGGTGVDTLKFSRDGVSVTDENVAKLTAIDVIQTANGTNRFLMHDAFYLPGIDIDSIIGGTGSNIIDMSSSFYDPFNAIGTNFNDVITFDMSKGSYTLIVNDDELRYAKVVGGGSSGNVSITNVNGAVADIQFTNLYDAKIGSVSYTLGNITLGEKAKASGLSTLNIIGCTADVRDFDAPLVINGNIANETVLTSYAALADLTFNGNNTTTDYDILKIVDSQARAINSLKGSFDALSLGGGNNFVSLANDASLSQIFGGGGIDTLNFLGNTTGINFVMDATVMGNTDAFAQITGGTGRDTISVNFGSTGNAFVDTQLARVDLWWGPTNRSSFSTDTLGGNDYTFDTNFDFNGIDEVYVHDNDYIDASTVNRKLNFIFGDQVNFPTVGIDGTTGDDTLTLNIATAPSTVTIDDVDFALKHNVEFLVLNSVEPTARFHANFTVELGATAQAAGISSVVGGNGGDSLDATAMTTAVTLSGGLNVRLTLDNQTSLTILKDTLVGGSGADSLHGDNFYDSLVGNNGADTLNGTSSTALGANEIDTLTGGGGNDVFVLGDASNAYYNTGGRASDYALITDFIVGSDKIQLKDLSALYSPTAPATNDYGYLIDGTDIHGVGALGVGVNSYLYADTDKSGTITTGDNLIAAINSTVVLTNVNATNFNIV